MTFDSAWFFTHPKIVALGDTVEHFDGPRTALVLGYEYTPMSVGYLPPSHGGAGHFIRTEAGLSPEEIADKFVDEFLSRVDGAYQIAWRVRPAIGAPEPDPEPSWGWRAHGRFYAWPERGA